MPYDDNGAVSFLQQLGQQMAEDRARNSISRTVTGAGTKPQPGILGALLGLGTDQQPIPQPAPQTSGLGGLFSQMIDGGNAAPNSVSAKDMTAMPAGASPVGTPAAASPAPAPQPAYSAAPSGPLPSFAAVQGAPAGVGLQSIFQSQEKANGLPAGYLARTAAIESKWNPNAVNKDSGAAGPFQFVPSTAAQYGLTDPTDWASSTMAAAKLGGDNARVLRNALGRDPTGGELYLAHQQGAGGASKLLANPDARAGDVVGDKAVRQNGGDPNMTAGQFASLWTSKFSGPGTIGSGPAPATQMASGSPYGSLDPRAFGQGGDLPTMVASGMGGQLSRPTPFPGTRNGPGNAGVAYSSTGQRVETDDDGNALDSNGRPTSLSYAPPGPNAPAQRAISTSVRGRNGGELAPGTVAAASPAAPYVQAPAQAAAPMQGGAGDGFPPLNPAMLKALIQNPDTQDLGLSLAKSFWTRAPVNWEHIEGKDGSIYAFMPSTGQFVRKVDAPAAKADYTFSEVNGRYLAGDKTTGVARDATPAGLPAGYRPMTDEERDAYRLQPNQAAFMGPDNKPAVLGGGNTSVNVDTRSENSEAQGRGAGLAKRLNELAESGSKAGGDAAFVDRLGDLMGSVDTGGKTAALERVRQMTGGAVSLDPNTDNVQALNAAIQYLAPRLRVPGSGAQSDRELGNFLASIPSLSASPGGNAQILQTLKGAVERNAAVGRIANDWQLGRVTAEEAQNRIDGLPSPFARQRQGGGTLPPKASLQDGQTYQTPRGPARWNARSQSFTTVAP